MAFGSGTINSVGGAVSDLFAASAHEAKAKGLRIEAQNYDLSSEFSLKSEKFTEVSTAVKQAQLDRENFQMIGGQQADVAGAGFAASGSALDLMRDSAQQGALTKAIGSEQGLITEEGYKVQAQSYKNMSDAARMAADAEDTAAFGANISAGFKAVSAITSIFTK